MNRRGTRIQEWVLGFFFSLSFYNDSVQRSESSCQPSKCEEDDGYARKPRRQRKAAVRSGFPTRHWLILPLGECVRACVRLGDVSVSTVSVLQASLDKMLGAGGIKDRPALVGERCANAVVFKNEQDGKTRQSFSETRRVAEHPVGWMPQRMFGGVSGEFNAAICQFPGTRHVLAEPVNVRDKKRAHWWFFDPNDRRRSHLAGHVQRWDKIRVRAWGWTITFTVEHNSTLSKPLGWRVLIYVSVLYNMQ